MRCWRALGARVVAIEPQPDFVRVLRWLYGRDGGVEIVPQAVGRTAGSAELLVSERTPTVTTLSRAWVDNVRREPGFEDVQWSARERVDVVTLQSLIERYGEPAFVKVDVEGFEAEALAGLATPVRALSFEYVPATREIAVDCIERLAALAAVPIQLVGRRDASPRKRAVARRGRHARAADRPAEGRSFG